jgi:hypothetical protein
MTKKPATRIRDAVQALAAIPDPTERALAANEMSDAVREATTDVARIRTQAIRDLRAAGESHRAIGEKLGIHFTRVHRPPQAGRCHRRGARPRRLTRAPPKPPATAERPTRMPAHGATAGFTGHVHAQCTSRIPAHSFRSCQHPHRSGACSHRWLPHGGQSGPYGSCGNVARRPRG